MKTIDLKEELYKYIDIGDEKFIKMLYEKAKDYIDIKKMDRMIAQGEADVESGKTFTLAQAKKMIE